MNGERGLRAGHHVDAEFVGEGQNARRVDRHLGAGLRGQTYGYLVQISDQHSSYYLLRLPARHVRVLLDVQDEGEAVPGSSQRGRGRPAAPGAVVLHRAVEAEAVAERRTVRHEE